MNYYECFAYLVKHIHTAIIVIVNEEYHPIRCAIDIIDFDEQGLHFLTVKGKNFYKYLKEKLLQTTIST